MPEPPRRRIDLLHLPAAARYAIAVAVLAFIVLIVVPLSGGGAKKPAGWYTVGVRIGAVVLLLSMVGWVIRRVAGRRRPR